LVYSWGIRNLGPWGWPGWKGLKEGGGPLGRFYYSIPWVWENLGGIIIRKELGRFLTAKKGRKVLKGKERGNKGRNPIIWRGAL